ncbi:MAG: response regulator transcription factor, partial [Bdellovibrionales bacterium]|nr:response regulator transcription factor [Bdellovibrionales bacterium]
MRTLIIEDDPVSRQLLHRLLSQNGVCDALESATLGLEAFSTSLKKNQRYDLICLDIMLPDANGMDVLRELRSLEAKAGVEGLDRSSVLMITSLD